MWTLRLLSHNVFWFQGVPFLTDRPGAADVGVVERLCGLYGEVDADVICLQEVQSEGVFDLVSERLGMEGWYCPGAAFPQYGGAVFWRRQAARLVCRSLESSLAVQRVWQVVEVEVGGRCVRVGNVHLPSGRQLGPELAAEQRIAELGDVIGSCDGGPEVIVGDFNEQAGGALGAVLEGHGYVDAAVLAGRSGEPTGIGGRRGDFAWVKTQTSDRGVEYGVAAKQELACDDIGKEYLSDHLPLWVSVEVG